tara:strand:+ start:141 stop:524 length:384 start_codon:yes stop_codon:yes gene_type:complete
MQIITPISLGELLDKISILKIKEINIGDENKKVYIKEELYALNKILDQNIDRARVEEYIEKLLSINKKLWNIEDQIRECERNKKFDNYFIELARSVYITNDIRSQIKLEVNKKFGSKLVEVKSYEKY